MANSIRVHSSTEYVIEVNDNGDTIVFDPGDPDFANKIIKAYERVQALHEEFEKRQEEINRQPDEPLNDLFTKNQYELIQLTKEFYKKAREAMDGFLGEGGCQKIFGDKNWITMFDDLAEQMEPHFKAMNVNLHNLYSKAVQKHAPNRAARRAMK